MSRKHPLDAFATQRGFKVEVDIESNVVRASDVPCLLADGTPGTCTIEKSFDATNDRPGTQERAAHAVRITAPGGSVYGADGTPIGNRIDGDEKTWSIISLKKGSPASPEDDKSARDVIHRYAKQIVGAAARGSGSVLPAQPDPFRTYTTFEQRAGLGPVQDRIREQRIAIIGLGGTGAYVLDLISKVPVKEIHLLDDDVVADHNLMRAPGAPTDQEIQSFSEERVLKVDYYYSKYSPISKYTPIQDGIQPHACRVDGASFNAFLEQHALDYAFVCIDQRLDDDKPRQDAVYQALADARIPFTDAGVSVTVDGDTVTGAVRVSTYEAGSTKWSDFVPNARRGGSAPDPGYRNVQMPEVNAAAAALAVMEWRRCSGQYGPEQSATPSLPPPPRLHRLRLEAPSIELRG